MWLTEGDAAGAPWLSAPARLAWRVRTLPLVRRLASRHPGVCDGLLDLYSDELCFELAEVDAVEHDEPESDWQLPPVLEGFRLSCELGRSDPDDPRD